VELNHLQGIGVLVRGPLRKGFSGFRESTFFRVQAQFLSPESAFSDFDSSEFAPFGSFSSGLGLSGFAVESPGFFPRDFPGCCRVCSGFAGGVFGWLGSSAGAFADSGLADGGLALS
jgi:hypothetical protein